MDRRAHTHISSRSPCGFCWTGLVCPPPSLLLDGATHREACRCTSYGWNLPPVRHPINKKPREGCVNCYHAFGHGIPINHPTNCNKLWADIKLWFRNRQIFINIASSPIKHSAGRFPGQTHIYHLTPPLFMDLSCPQRLSAARWVNETPSCLFIISPWIKPK